MARVEARFPKSVLRFSRFSGEYPDTHYFREFSGVFPKKTKIIDAGIESLETERKKINGLEFADQKLKAAKGADLLKAINGRDLELEVKLCRRVADILEEKIIALKDTEPAVIFEEDTHEAVLPFYSALNKVFGSDFYVLSLDDHLDAQANSFTYNSFWKFAINNGLIDPLNLAVLGSRQMLFANKFLSFFKFEDKEKFISSLLSPMPRFGERLLYQDKEKLMQINSFMKENLSPKVTSKEQANYYLFLFNTEISFGSGLRSLWEAQGLIGKGVKLIPPPGDTRDSKGNVAKYMKSLDRIMEKVRDKLLLVSLDIDVKLHPENLYSLASAIKKAKPGYIAFNLAGLFSRHLYPGGVTNPEISDFLRILRS